MKTPDPKEESALRCVQKTREELAAFRQDLVGLEEKDHPLAALRAFQALTRISSFLGEED